MQLASESRVPVKACACTSTMHAQRQLAFEAAREHWPTLRVRFDRFCAHLNQLGYTRELPSQTRALYLCVACSEGSEVACRLLETKYFPALRACVAKYDPRPEMIEDVLQQVRYRLLVGPSARIKTYRGRGSFDGWLREVARTVAVDCIRLHQGRERRVRRLRQDAVCQEQTHAAPTASPEEQTFRQRHGRLVQSALHRAIQRLPGEHRQLLHHYYVSGLNIDELGALYGVNRSTAARRIVRSVREIQRSLRKELKRDMGSLSAEDLEGWVPILYRRLNVDVVGMLAASNTAAPLPIAIPG